MKLRITKDIPGYMVDTIVEPHNYWKDSIISGSYRYIISDLIKDGYAEEILESVPTPKPQKPSERIAELRETIRMPYQESWKILVEIQSIIRYLDEIHENK